MKCGLLGRKLEHSYSPDIHQHFGDYPYELYEIEPEELEEFLRKSDFTGINVTMPYKEAVIPYLDELTPMAQKLGAVNTIVRRDGKLIGHNTDYFGFRYLLQQSGLEITGKKCLVLGSGGASKTVRAVLAKMGAEVVVISRSGENNYDNLQRHEDAAILVNTTPVGMYPDTGFSPVDLGLFSRLEGVVDVIYNPARTQLLLDAEARCIPFFNGLTMLAAQAKEASEWFTGNPLPDSEIQRVHRIMKQSMENIVLIGMPGCGKSTVGQLLADKLRRRCVDTDREMANIMLRSVPSILNGFGEQKFREIETRILESYSNWSSIVLATGGGCVTKPENYPLLRQNGTIIWRQRDLEKLSREGRPLSTDLEEMYRVREPMYADFADFVIDNNGDPETTVETILEVCF